MSRIAYLYPGQGSQEVGMGKDFYESSPFAREVFDRADEILGYEISRLCLEGPEEDLKLTRNTQPALLVVSTIASGLIGKDPDIAAGHSLGEYSALVHAGALSFDDAVRIVHNRGRYMQEAVPVGVGAMAALLGADYDDVKHKLSAIEEGVVEIANWNSKEQIVIAGDKKAVEQAVSVIDPPRAVMLPVSAPFHCALMKSAEEKLSYDLDHVEFRDLKFPIITNVEARIITRGDEARESLKKQVSRTVLWYETMQVMNTERIDSFVELGAGNVLSGLIKRTARNWETTPAVFSAGTMETVKKARRAIDV
jgi:[acyl-carrier-protein] S-malonyltransferase